MVPEAVAARLRTEGVCKVDGLTADELAAANAYLLAAPVFDRAHVPQTARNENRGPVARTAASGDCLCVHTWDALRAPYLFEFGLAYTILVTPEYLGTSDPVAYSVNAFWTRPSANPTRPDIQEYHTDKDDDRFLALFVYLTDVLSPEDGPHELVGPDGRTRAVYGPAGTAFLADTAHPHRGLKPRSRERGLWWWRWGISQRPAANVWDRIEPLPRSCLGDGRYPEDTRLQESIRLLVA